MCSRISMNGHWSARNTDAATTDTATAGSMTAGTRTMLFSIIITNLTSPVTTRERRSSGLTI